MGPMVNTLKKTRNQASQATGTSHTHGNITTLNNLTQDVIDNSHSHINKTILDNTEESFTTALLNIINDLQTRMSDIESHTHNYEDNNGTVDTTRTTTDVNPWYWNPI